MPLRHWGGWGGASVNPTALIHLLKGLWGGQFRSRKKGFRSIRNHSFVLPARLPEHEEVTTTEEG